MAGRGKTSLRACATSLMLNKEIRIISWNAGIEAHPILLSHGQGHVPPTQVAPNPIQLCLEHFQGG